MSGQRSSIRRAAGRIRRRTTAPLVTAVVVVAMVALPATSAMFSATTGNAGNTFAAASLDAWLPTAATAATSCLVSWTPVTGVPAGLTYEVSDGTSAVATGLTTTSATITVPAWSVTPTVRTVLGSWHSASAVIADPCVAVPDAPGGLTLTPSDGQIAVSWTAPAGNGAPVQSYTATLSPGGAACTPSAPITGCTFTCLTDGVSYTVSVRATSAEGTGPAGTGTAIPYPSSVMSGARLALWLDGADQATLFAAPGCTAPTVSTAGQSLGCWADKSGHGNSVTQPSSSAPPVLTPVAGWPVPGFDGSGSYLTAGIGSMPIGSTTSTTLLAASPTASIGYGVAVAWGTNGLNAGRQIYRRDSALEADDWGTEGPVSNLVGSTPQVVAAQHAPTAVTLWHDGRPGLTLPATTSTGSTFLTVGRQGSNAVDYYWQGAIPGIIVFTGVLTDPERRTIEEYLARKWASAITPPAPAGLGATVSGTSATVSWTAPTWDGDSGVTGYTVTATGGTGPLTCTAVAPVTSCTLTGLNPSGTSYTLTVTATNAIGTGPASSTATLSTGAPYVGDLKLWLAADDLDGDGTTNGASEAGLVSGAVQTWKDKSGHSFDVTAPSAGERPGSAAQVLNHIPVVTSNGSTVLMGTGSNSYGIAGDRTQFIVTRPRTMVIGSAAIGTFVADRNGVTNNLFGFKITTGGAWALQTRNDAGSGDARLGGPGRRTGRHPRGHPQRHRQHLHRRRHRAHQRHRDRRHHPAHDQPRPACQRNDQQRFRCREGAAVRPGPVRE